MLFVNTRSHGCPTGNCNVYRDLTVLKQASGVDTGWMLPADHQDFCGGFRQSSFDSAVFFAVSEVQKLWETTHLVFQLPSWVNHAGA